MQRIRIIHFGALSRFLRLVLFKFLARGNALDSIKLSDTGTTEEVNTGATGY